jgi:hypothetical protein
MMPFAQPMQEVEGSHLQTLDEDSNPGDSVVFIEMPEPAKELSMVGQIIKAAEQAAEPSTIKVKVNSPYRVLHDHVAYIADETLEVPNDSEHQLWVKSGWVEIVTKGSK